MEIKPKHLELLKCSPFYVRTFNLKEHPVFVYDFTLKGVAFVEVIMEMDEDVYYLGIGRTMRDAIEMASVKIYYLTLKN